MITNLCALPLGETICLVIGNSRLHFAGFQGEELQWTWDREHLIAGELPEEIVPPQVPVYIASVVPAQAELWSNYPDGRFIGLGDIPLKGVYPTLGVDRALALWGAGVTWGFPCLVIDGGTALTFTGANGDRLLVGGAILPGLRLQLKSLGGGTAALPLIGLSKELPNRWGLDTPGAIQSGVIYTVLAGIKDFLAHWWKEFPGSLVVLTGGDGGLLLSYLRVRYPELGEKVIGSENLVFWGMRGILS